MRKPRNKFKTLINSYPLHTAEAKKKLAAEQDITIDKINRWYRKPEAIISVEDQFKLKAFFNLESIEELFELEVVGPDPQRKLRGQ